MKWRKSLYWLGLAFGFVMFIYQIWLALEAIRGHPGAIVQPGWAVAAFGLNIVAYALLMAGWGLVMRGIGVSLRPRQVLQGYLLSFIPRYIPGTVWGYISRNEWLHTHCGASYRQASLGSLFEVALLVATCCGVLAVYLLPSYLGLPAAGVFLAAELLGTAITRRWMLAKDPCVALEHWSFASWLWSIGGAIVYNLFWVVCGMATWCIIAALGADEAVSLATSIYVFAASWLIGFFAILVPAGVGVREWTLNEMLMRTGQLYAWQPPLIAVLSRFTMIAAELLLLGLGLLSSMQQQLRSRRRGGTYGIP